MRLTARKPRSAFTLIELIVVMAIIAVIATLTIGAIGKSFNWIKQKNTEQTMSKVMTRFQRLIDKLYKEADDWPTNTESFIFDQANGNVERARVIKVLYLLKWNFPNSYAEAYHNVQESRQLYDNRLLNPANLADPANFPGYPTARALLMRLRKNNSTIPDPYLLPFLPAPYANVNGPTVPVYSPWAAGTPALNTMATVLPRQSSACMLAAYMCLGGSADDFPSNEVVVDASTGDSNPYLIDGWETPLMFLRHGNFAHSRHRVGGGGVQRPAWTVGMVRPAGLGVNDFAPLEYVLNQSTNLPPADGNITSGWDTGSQYYLKAYFAQLQRRANSAYINLSSRDPLDPTSLLKSNLNWRVSAGSSTPALSYPVGTANWLRPNFATWLAPNADNQHGIWFRTTFGYMPELADQNYGSPSSANIFNQAYTPMVIISAGGDKLFNQWDDNLDSYRLQINVSGQQ
jgi:prepilin-type N-terminal cleavage/methylation domain-containing protein